MNALLDPPRWPGGPSICPTANLPCFDSKNSASAFLDANSPSATVIAMWTCTACDRVHVWSIAGCPSGASSGTTRVAKHIESLRERFLKSKVALTMPVTNPIVSK